jgi:hypothetical protein
VNDELERISKEAAMAYLRYNSSIHLEGLTKTIKNLSQDSQSQGQDLNPEPPEYKAGL